MKDELDEALEQLAIDTVCPNSHKPVTPWERNRVKELLAFAFRVKATVEMYEKHTN